MNTAHALGHFLRTLPASAAATFLALFPIVDPFGGIPIFYSLTSSWPAKERRRTALKTALYVFGILVVFLFFGRFVLYFFGISLPVLKIAGGLIVANTAWGMVTSTARMTTAETDEASTKEDISLTHWRCRCFRVRARSESSWLWPRMSTIVWRISAW
jgi:MarC family membrane protein